MRETAPALLAGQASPPAMPRAGGASLGKNFVWTCAANVAYGVSQLGMLVALAKLGSAENVGQLALGLAISTPVIMFTNLHLREVQATDAGGEYAFGDYRRLRLIGCGIAIATVALAAFGTAYPPATAWAVLWVGVGRAVDALGDIYYGLLQQNERMDRIGKSSLLKAPVSCLAMAVVFRATESVAWGAAAAAMVSAAVLLCYDMRAPQALRRAAAPSARLSAEDERGGSAGQLWALARSALPLGVVMALVSLNANLPRYFIERHLGQVGLGHFAAMAQLMAAGNMVVTALAQSGSARLARHHARRERIAFITLLVKLMGVATLLGGAGVLVAAVAGPDLLVLLYRREFARNADVLVWLMVAAGVSYLAAVLGSGMTVARYFRAQVPLFAVTALTTAAASAWLVPEKGLVGGAIAVLLGILVQTAGGGAILTHALRGEPNDGWRWTSGGEKSRRWVR
jgi:O-antigen/teichoic acid export membrane protein